MVVGSRSSLLLWEPSNANHHATIAYGLSAPITCLCAGQRLLNVATADGGLTTFGIPAFEVHEEMGPYGVIDLATTPDDLVLVALDEEGYLRICSRNPMDWSEPDEVGNIPSSRRTEPIATPNHLPPVVEALRRSDVVVLDVHTDGNLSSATSVISGTTTSRPAFYVSTHCCGKKCDRRDTGRTRFPAEFPVRTQNVPSKLGVSLVHHTLW